MKSLKFLACFVGLLMVSCGEDDTVAPIVNITSPNSPATISVDQQINLQADVSDDVSLENILISSDLGLSETITTFDSETSHKINLNINLDPMTPAGSYSIDVTATDGSENEASDSVLSIVQ